MTPYRVLVAGPAGIGKTSLLSALLSAVPSFFSGPGTGVQWMATKQAEDAIRRQTDRLRQTVDSGTFQPALRPTTAPSRLPLSFSYTEQGILGRLLKGSAQADIVFHDCPGDLFSNLPRLNETFLPLAEADCLLVPLNAPLLMEADSPDRQSVAHALHQVAMLEEIVVEWQKGRARRESGLLLLCPILCESYLSARSQELADRVCNTFFTNALDIVMAFGTGISCLYSPVETLGSCRLSSACWNTEPEHYAFDADYAVSGPWQVTGADIILLLILEQAFAHQAGKAPSKAATAAVRALLDRRQTVSPEVRARILRVC